MGIINILALGPPGSGKTSSIINLANYYWNKNYYDYQSDVDFLNIVTLTPYEFIVTRNEKWIIRIFDLTQFPNISLIKNILDNFNATIHGLMLFFDGIGYSMSKELAITISRKILPNLNLSDYLFIGLIGTKRDIKWVFSENFFLKNLENIIRRDFYQNRECFYISNLDSKKKSYFLNICNDKPKLFYFYHLEQLMVSLIEKRLAIIPKYDFLSGNLLRFWVRNLLGCVLIENYKLNNKKKNILLHQLFKTNPTALENDSSFKDLTLEYTQWPEDIIPIIWHLPINLDILEEKLEDFIEKQFCSTSKLKKFSEELEPILIQNNFTFDIDIFATTSSSKAKTVLLNRFIDNITIIKEHKSNKQRKPNITTWNSLSLDEFE